MDRLKIKEWGEMEKWYTPKPKGMSAHKEPLNP